MTNLESTLLCPLIQPVLHRFVCCRFMCSMWRIGSLPLSGCPVAPWKDLFLYLAQQTLLPPDIFSFSDAICVSGIWTLDDPWLWYTDRTKLHPCLRKEVDKLLFKPRIGSEERIVDVRILWVFSDRKSVCTVRCILRECFIGAGGSCPWMASNLTNLSSL